MSWKNSRPLLCAQSLAPSDRFERESGLRRRDREREGEGRKFLSPPPHRCVYFAAWMLAHFLRMLWVYSPSLFLWLLPPPACFTGPTSIRICEPPSSSHSLHCFFCCPLIFPINRSDSCCSGSCSAVCFSRGKHLDKDMSEATGIVNPERGVGVRFPFAVAESGTRNLMTFKLPPEWQAGCSAK